jgi:hypothetical protein
MAMQDKIGKDATRGFVFRVKMGDYEVEVCGTREEVMKTIEDLPNLAGGIYKAFDSLRPKSVTTLTVKTGATTTKQANSDEKYPKIAHAEDGDEAVLKILETDWGKWRPRTLDELREALNANGLSFSGRALPNVLSGLVKNGKVRRWNTDAGFVYILAEKEALA